MACPTTKIQFRHASDYHSSSLRFIIAGLYLDAILSIIEGLSKLQIDLDVGDPPDDPIYRFFETKNNSSLEEKAVFIDRTPFDHSTVAHVKLTVPPPEVDANFGCPSCGAVASVMIYNLALAYHLKAASDDRAPGYCRQLTQAKNLYKRAEQMITKHPDLKSRMPPSLEYNLRHVRHDLTLYEQHNRLKKEEYAHAI